MDYLKQFETLDELQTIRLTDKSILYYNGTTELDFGSLVKIGQDQHVVTGEGKFYVTKHKIKSILGANLQQSIQNFIDLNILQYIDCVGSLLSVKGNSIILWNGDKSESTYWDPFSTTITEPLNSFGTPIAVCIGKGKWVYVGTPVNKIWNNHPWANSNTGVDATTHTIVCYEYDGYKNTKYIIDTHRTELQNTIWEQIKSTDFIPHEFLHEYTYVPSFYELMEMNATIAKSQYTNINHIEGFHGYDIGLTNIGYLIFKQQLYPEERACLILSSTEFVVSQTEYLTYNLRDNTTAAKNKTDSNVYAITFLHF